VAIAPHRYPAVPVNRWRGLQTTTGLGNPLAHQRGGDWIALRRSRKSRSNWVTKLNYNATSTRTKRPNTHWFGQSTGTTQKKLKKS